MTIDWINDWTPPDVAVGYPPEVAGKGPLDNRIARSISRALSDARTKHGRTRKAIAEMMSEELGRKISESSLDRWSAESSPHRIPLDAFIALIKATGIDDLAGFIPRLFDLEVVPKKYKAVIDLRLLEEHEAVVANQKNALLLKLRNGE